MTEAPLISVLMPVAKARQYLPSAMESVLSQTHLELELILIDDDGRVEQLSRSLPKNDPRARAIASAGKGISDALNTGVEAARGELMCRIDCDDLIPPDRFARQVKWLRGHGEFAAVCGSMSTMTSEGNFVADLNASHSRGEITEELRSGVTRTSLCTYLARTDAVRETGKFRPWFITAEDIDFQLRFGERHRVWYEPMLTYLYRLHDSSITHSQANTARVFFHETARQFQQQRLASGQDDLERGTAPSPPADASNPFDSSQAVQNLLVGASWERHRAGRKMAAVRLGWRACLSRPRTLWAWRNLAVLAIKPVGKPAASTTPDSGGSSQA